MGKYFMMSTRFNKRSAEDFGLTDIGNGIAIDDKNGSHWEKHKLYDLGWGNENGYYKLPMLNFHQLWSIILGDFCDEDIYGAAAIIIEQFPEELLIQCERVLRDKKEEVTAKRLIKLFDLCSSINRCPILNKSCEQIQKDFERWKHIAVIASNIS